MGEDGKISWCDTRDSMLRNLFDAISGLLLPPSRCDVKRTAVTNRKWHQKAYEARCHARHTMRFCRLLPSAVPLRKVAIVTEESLKINLISHSNTGLSR